MPAVIWSVKFVTAFVAGVVINELYDKAFKRRSIRKAAKAAA